MSLKVIEPYQNPIKWEYVHVNYPNRFILLVGNSKILSSPNMMTNHFAKNGVTLLIEISTGSKSASVHSGECKDLLAYSSKKYESYPT